LEALACFPTVCIRGGKLYKLYEQKCGMEKKKKIQDLLDEMEEDDDSSDEEE
jgi:hypothetical protein